ncbi:MAG: lipopolysaccharide heptosyltransferase family protein [Planctomycetota bacterium]|nr:MAG: lipopolysaccharide heptosyltransferase family protein [Planctomycetota bacterium]
MHQAEVRSVHRGQEADPGAGRRHGQPEQRLPCFARPGAAPRPLDGPSQLGQRHLWSHPTSPVSPRFAPECLGTEASLLHDARVKLLLVRLSALGDAVHTLPALERLRAALPDARLVWALEPPAADLLWGHPAVDRVLRLDRPGLRRASTRGRALRSFLGGLRALRAERFDAALDLQALLRSALVARASGARRVLGPRWAREGARYLYSSRLDAPRPSEAHAVARADALVRAGLQALGRPCPGGPLPAPRLPRELLAEGDACASDAAEHRRPRVILLPGAGKPSNRPPPTLLAAVAARLAAELGGARFEVLGGPGDLRRAQAVAAHAPVPVAVRCGQDIRTSARLLARADLVIGGDTGPLHLARALGRPLVGLYPAASPLRTGPVGLPGDAPVAVLAGETSCAPCCARVCRRPDRVRRCLSSLEPERVAETALGVLDAARVTS